jgi:enoyl reductase-like protein
MHASHESAADEPVKYLLARVKEALACDSRTNVLDVQVRYAGKRLFLMGATESETMRRSVENVVREVAPPDMVVVNELSIVHYQDAEDSEEVP